MELLGPSLKNEKTTPRKFLIFWEMKISQKKIFVIFQETEIPKNFFTLQEPKVFYIS